MSTTRRTFLKGAASTIAGAPLILPNHMRAADTKANSRLGLGYIGAGRLSRHLLPCFLYEDVQFRGVCDVDTTRREHAKKTVDDFYKAHPAKGQPGCKACNDFRELLADKDIDVVVIAVPDHWHAYITMAAIQAGKDIYCEKPLTHDIHEAIAVMNAVPGNKRILQTGSMQRSMSEFRVACELVRNGAIGKIERVECSFGDPPVACDLPAEKPEPGLDWDRWLGPAPERPYNSVLSPRGICDHFPKWRNYREYGGGQVTDWGAHQLDIAQWGLDMDASGPVEARPPEDPTAKRGATLVYENGVTVTHKDGFGADFFGSDGRVQVNRGTFSFSRGGKTIARHASPHDKLSCAAAVQLAQREYLKDAKVRLYKSTSHYENFIDCVKNRTAPICPEQVGGRSAICCHLMNLAYQHGQTIKWDPAKLAFAQGTGDKTWLKADYRKPWSV